MVEREDIVEVDEALISQCILEESLEFLRDIITTDLVIVGAGPSGLTASIYASRAGLKTVLIERRLSFGGGMGGGAMHLPTLVIEEPATEILDDIGCRYKRRGEGVATVDSSELMIRLANAAIDAGVRFLHGVTVDDIVFREDGPRVAGVAIEWTASQMASLHTDPLFLKTSAVLDATGHDAEIVSVASRKVPELNILPVGEKSASSSSSERQVVEKTGRVAPGLYCAGMAVSEVHGLPRMGPIFGAMLLSGRKAARIIIRDLRGE